MYIFKSTFLISLLTSVFLSYTYAQELYTLVIVPDTNTCQNLEITQTNKVHSSQLMNKKLNEYIYTLFDQGYLQAYYDTILKENNIYTAYLICGEKVPFLINIEHVDISTLQKIDFYSDFSTKKIEPFQHKKISNFFQKLASHYENNGYPFVSIQLDSIKYINDTLFATVICNPYQLVSIDSIVQKGNVFIQPNVLQALIRVKPNTMYSEKNIQNITELIMLLPFIKEVRPTEVQFYNDNAKIYLYYDKKKSNLFDGIVGFMPDYQNQGKLLFTGDMTLVLNNSLQVAERISLKWRQFEKSSQDVRFQFTLPTLVYLPLGANYQFSILKKDSAYINLNQRIALQYNSNIRQKTSMYLHYYSSSLINVKQYQNAKVLPNVSDIKTTSVGILFEYNKLNNFLSPTKGHHLTLDVSVGQKNIQKNTLIPVELYNNISLSNTQFKAESEITYFIPFLSSSTFMFKNISGTIYSEKLFENELFRIGGIHTLRGFDEHFFLPSTFSIQTLEYRWIFDTQSWMSLFTDMGYIEQQLISRKNLHRVLSFGAGITLDTEAGQFSLHYAYGRTHLIPFNYKTGKIHFGYIALF